MYFCEFNRFRNVRNAELVLNLFIISVNRLNGDIHFSGNILGGKTVFEVAHYLEVFVSNVVRFQHLALGLPTKPVEQLHCKRSKIQALRSELPFSLRLSIVGTDVEDTDTFRITGVNWHDEPASEAVFTRGGKHLALTLRRHDDL